ncbi:DNA polymerase processivity subunit [Eptesicus fuscus gammaherpesvirus]|uniref:DNA polymerase processivity subunit n=1 Tax=vespertilionid gammaherpesvirus 3 TaxID=2846598 RepID=A0A2D1A3K3_9GAMA|nr:DNA polymerase processivity subunit [Eptesicus fuscus gammaherpesvirus]ATA58290.1 DNA polymerase processivity subunit [Eptesicus fuscus gammaherpesvirus]WAH70942.1 DNA polymerase processivlty factor [Eptesicus fuscus gammaherpesvirus]
MGVTDVPADMEVTHTVEIDPKTLLNVFKVYEHIKATVAKGLVQISGTEEKPVLSLLSSVDNAAILRFSMCLALKSCSVTHGPRDNISLSFRNTSLGGSFVSTREFFGPHTKNVSMVFYRRPGEQRPEFFSSRVTYQDGHTQTTHKSVTEPWMQPFDESAIGASHLIAKVLLSIKSLSTIYKWLRGYRVANETRSVSVRISVQLDMSMLVFSIGNATKTVVFQTCAEDIQCALLRVHKPGDHVAATRSCRVIVAIDPLISALTLCKVPGIINPCLWLYEGDILEVVGVPARTYNYEGVKLSVILFKDGRPPHPASQELSGSGEAEHPYDESLAATNALLAVTEADVYDVTVPGIALELELQAKLESGVTEEEAEALDDEIIDIPLEFRDSNLPVEPASEVDAELRDQRRAQRRERLSEWRRQVLNPSPLDQPVVLFDSAIAGPPSPVEGVPSLLFEEPDGSIVSSTCDIPGPEDLLREGLDASAVDGPEPRAKRQKLVFNPII